MPSGFELVLGQGGGFNGSWSGYTIAEDGTVSRWSGPVAEVAPKPAGHIEPSRVASIWAELQAIGFDTTDMDERGEITAFLRVKTDSLNHRVSWIPGVEGVEEPGHPVESLYRDLRKVAMAASEPH